MARVPCRIFESCEQMVRVTAIKIHNKIIFFDIKERLFYNLDKKKGNNFNISVKGL